MLAGRGGSGYLSRMARYCYLLICFFMLHACSAQRRAEKSKQSQLEYGMTHAEALAAITDRSEVLIGEFNFPEGHMEAYQYTRYGAASLKVPKYYLYFLNDTLVRKSPEEDLRAGSRLALKDHRQYLADKAEAAQREAEAEERQAAREAQQKERQVRQQARTEKQTEKKQPSRTKKSSAKKTHDDDDEEDDW